ncbi:CHAD domain-containing protein [Paraflavitalea speifideaquila]|uniref:CHAD domain-containing protein n=1 Tax=Paraflavitalea speifideaquila TaxID=3076558 RepID=UPI0028EF94F7|nr:CHAD domain-containing protein [Paraflavitalea speifideiaquila]
MKRAYLAEVIKKHGGRIKRYSNQLPGSFETETIHELRVEYKKLRAFIRMLQMDAEARHLTISPAIKMVYQSAGHVRDLQLFLPLVIGKAEQENQFLLVIRKTCSNVCSKRRKHW